jgi:hypothetical protein
VPLCWLCYLRAGKVEDCIIESSSLIHARMKLALAGLDGGARFSEGHELNDAMAALVPRNELGRWLAKADAGNLHRC